MIPSDETINAIAEQVCSCSNFECDLRDGARQALQLWRTQVIVKMQAVCKHPPEQRCVWCVGTLNEV
jgi:hypothetical protein